MRRLLRQALWVVLSLTTVAAFAAPAPDTLIIRVSADTLVLPAGREQANLGAIRFSRPELQTELSDLGVVALRRLPSGIRASSSLGSRRASTEYLLVLRDGASEEVAERVRALAGIDEVRGTPSTSLPQLDLGRPLGIEPTAACPGNQVKQCSMVVIVHGQPVNAERLETFLEYECFEDSAGFSHCWEDCASLCPTRTAWNVGGTGEICDGDNCPTCTGGTAVPYDTGSLFGCTITSDPDTDNRCTCACSLSAVEQWVRERACSQEI